MPGLDTTIGKLLTSRRKWETLMSPGVMPGRSSETALQGVADFGANPGDLRMLVHVPAGLPPGAPLVVVLHGCTQTAAAYDSGAGWSALADRHGFALLFPEQKRSNNANLCFNWFQPDDIQRDHGEVASVRQMVAWMLDAHRLDRRRVFVNGLSAGGAMTAALLASYPDVFAAGAIIAGLPYRCASNTQEALDCMFQGQSLPARAWGDLVRQASSHTGPWPQVAVWHGTADTTVRPINATESVKQWTNVHGLSAEPTFEDKVEGCVHRVWNGPDGAPAVSSFLVPGMGHGTPIDPDRCGTPGPHMLDVGVSSTLHIAASWGLTRDTAPAAAKPADTNPAQSPTSAGLDPASVIARALRSVGLLPLK